MQAERTAEGGAEEAERQAVCSSRRPGARAPAVPPKLCGAGTSPLPAEEVPPRGRGTWRSRRGAAPPGGPGRVQSSGSSSAQLGSGSASRAAAAAGGGGGGPGRARAVWPRQVLRLQLRGCQLLAPRPSPRGRSPAHRLPRPRRSRPAAVGGPAPTLALPLPAFPSSPPGHAAFA